MGKRHKNLLGQITDRDNLWLAYRKTTKGKRGTEGYLRFRQSDGANIVSLAEALEKRIYKPGRPRVFFVYEPKPRQISALLFLDRIVQHAICNIIDPIFEKTFLPQSFACRKEKGTHKAAIKVQSLSRKYAGGFYLKTDFRKYFASINREILFKELKRKISCKATLNLLGNFLPADTGIPIGNLTSQLFANVYGHIFDRWLQHNKGISEFVRYMDDVIVFGKTKEELSELHKDLERFISDEMKLSLSKWHIKPIKDGINFCGYRIWPTHKLLRKRSVSGAKRKIKRFIKKGDNFSLKTFIAAWLGHAMWANTFNLIKRLGVKNVPV